jgi:flavin reductase (DIM6/NTAB) family NADH-FMN oxidoreductase RutF
MSKSTSKGELQMKDKSPAAFRSVLNPKTPLLVSCRGKDGKNNALVVVYCTNCSYDPPMIMVGIVPSRYSYGIVKETGVFVANLVSSSMRDAFNYLGSHSGRDEDKLAKLGLRLGEGVKVNAPILLDCPVSIECTVTDSIRTGSHEMFIGKIEYVHADSSLVDAEGKIDWSKIDFLPLN